jgi:hypothetical protein
MPNRIVPVYSQELYYPESRNKAKFIREESQRPDEDTLDTIDLVDFIVDHEQQ